jgi:hypothetical protein
VQRTSLTCPTGKEHCDVCLNRLAQIYWRRPFEGMFLDSSRPTADCRYNLRRATYALMQTYGSDLKTYEMSLSFWMVCQRHQTPTSLFRNSTRAVLLVAEPALFTW